jgi:hypothetical protein
VEGRLWRPIDHTSQRDPPSGDHARLRARCPVSSSHNARSQRRTVDRKITSGNSAVCCDTDEKSLGCSTWYTI